MLVYLSSPHPNVLEGFKHFDYKQANAKKLTAMAKDALAIDVLLLCNKSSSYDVRIASVLAINELIDGKKTTYEQNKHILEFLTISYNSYSNVPTSATLTNTASVYRARSYTKLTIPKLIELIELENLKYTDEKTKNLHKGLSLPQ
jgi:hypothetical protein